MFNFITINESLENPKLKENSHTLSKSVSVQFYYNKWISGLIPNGNELLNSNRLSHTLSKSVSVQFYYNKWISGLIPNGNELLNPNQNPKSSHHRDMTNLLNYTTNSNWLSHTLSKSVSVQFYYNKWISGMISNGNELLNPNQNPKLKENICIIEIWPINGIIPLIRIDSLTLFPRV